MVFSLPSELQPRITNGLRYIIDTGSADFPAFLERLEECEKHSGVDLFVTNYYCVWQIKSCVLIEIPQGVVLLFQRKHQENLFPLHGIIQKIIHGRGTFCA